jgi:hypothetical protein
MNKLNIILITIFLTGIFTGCDETEGGKGNIQFYIQPEECISDGIVAGTLEENMRDGWNLEYDKFLISFGDIYVSKTSSSSTEYVDSNHYIVDLKKTSTGGLEIISFENVDSGLWDKIGYSIVQANAQSVTLGTISSEDADYMKNNNLVVSTKMILTKPGGQICSYLVGENEPADPARPCYDATEVVMDWDLPYAARAEGCSTPDVNGIIVPKGGTAAATLTIHADHHFFNAFVHSDVKRLVQHLVDADLNHDGNVTMEELAQVPFTVLDPLEFGDLVSTIPQDTPLENLRDLIKWATITFPHFQGTGGCPIRTPL